MTKTTRRTRHSYPTRPHRPGPTDQAMRRFAAVLRERIAADEANHAQDTPCASDEADQTDADPERSSTHAIR